MSNKEVRKVNFDKLQELYDSVLENKTTLYYEHILNIEDELNDKIGEKYKDVKYLFVYSLIKDSDGRLFSDEEIFKIKISRMLMNLQDIHAHNERFREEEKKYQEDTKFIW